VAYLECKKWGLGVWGWKSPSGSRGKAPVICGQSPLKLMLFVIGETVVSGVLGGGIEPPPFQSTMI